MKTISVSESTFERFKLAKIEVQAKKKKELSDDQALSEILFFWKENAIFVTEKTKETY